MAAVTASVALDTARTLLNDDAGSIFTDAVLMPKLQEAFRQMEAALRLNAQSIMIRNVVNTVNAGIALLSITDINEPIKLWEKATAATDDLYTPMTEYDPLPNDVTASTLRYWQWDGTQVNFIAASANRSVKTRYWRVLTEPTVAGSSLVLINAEYYLGPMTASIMAGSLGEDDQMTTLAAFAGTVLKMVIDANSGRAAPPESSRP